MDFVPLPDPSWLTVALILLVGVAIVVALVFALSWLMNRGSL